jgi:hypothetical protein
MALAGFVGDAVRSRKADDSSAKGKSQSAQPLRAGRLNNSDLERKIMLGTVLVILLVLLLLGALPTWPHSRNWGYYPSGGVGLVLVILVVLLLLGRL